MGVLSVIAGPLIGAVIGYITNYIAIKMLFRPLEPVYLFGKRLPFTPGIVPRRKDELAGTLGKMIVAKLFNADDLELVFTSDYLSDAVAENVVKFLRSDMRPELLCENLPEGTIERAETELCVRIQTAICKYGLPLVFAQKGGEMVTSIMGGSTFSKAVAGGTADAITKPLAKEIEEFIINEGFELIIGLLDTELRRLADTPVSDLSKMISADDEELKAAVKSGYLKFMSKNVRPIVESIDVGGMITEKIVRMEPVKVEDMVLSVVSRELKLIVLLGAVLGAVIGTLNIIL
ncbi:MAG: DUF445 family protein [Oscillospiraceae bacterium]|nr:DUF445 family protein [Oscillospiraceae bacterium]